MSRKYKIRDQEKLYFLSFATVNWVDVFTRNTYKDIFIESLKYCQQNKSLELYTYVIMSNHVHLIVGTTEGNRLENIIRDLKKYTSFRLLEAIKTNPQESRKDWMLKLFETAGKKNPNNKNYQFWQQGYHPIELFDNNIMEQKLDYIHNNPVKSGIVLSPEEYLYSSAKNYANKPEILIEVILLA